MEAQQIWQAALDRIQEQITPAIFNTWFRGTSALSFEDGMLTINTSSPFAQTQLEERYVKMVQEAIDKGISVRFVYEGRSNGNHEQGDSQHSTGTTMCPYCGNKLVIQAYRA